MVIQAVAAAGGAAPQHIAHPGGGPRGKGASSEAKRNAEALFESRTVAEIREIEARTRKDIESKKQQLRQLVGDSYRDLIDSADKIVNMSSNCSGIMQNIKDIQQGFSFLAHSFTTADSLLNEKRDSMSRHEELYAVSGRVRYLVDTPEVIWGFLDSQRHLDAAQRFLRARLVHEQLLANFPRAMLAKFPLLAHQWPVVLKFKDQIGSVVQGCLSAEVHSLERTAHALAALAALDGLDAAGALQALLAARKSTFLQQLAAAATIRPSSGPDAGGAGVAGSAETTAVSRVLIDAAATIQATIWQVGALFLPTLSAPGAGPAPSLPSPLPATAAAGASHEATSVPAQQQQQVQHGVCLLQLLVREDDVDASELLFGGRHVAAAAAAAGPQGAAQAPELAEWRRTSRKLQEQLIALGSGVVERAATQWVRELAEAASAKQHASGDPGVPAHLLGACATAAQLVEVEAAVRGAIAAWRMPLLSKLLAGAQDRATLQDGAGGAAGRLSLASGKAALLTTGNQVAALLLQATSASPFGGVGSATVLSCASTTGALAPGWLGPPGRAQSYGLGRAGDGQQHSWEAVCDVVLGAQLNLWQELYSALVLQRAKQLLADGFKAVVAVLAPQLDACLALADEVSRAQPDPPGHVTCARWPEVPPGHSLTLGAGTGGRASGSGTMAGAAEPGAGDANGGSMAKPGSAAAAMRVPWSERLGPGGLLARKEDLGQGGKAFRASVHALRKQADSQLQAVLHSALLLVSAVHPAAPGAALAPMGPSALTPSGSGLLTLGPSAALGRAFYTRAGSAGAANPRDAARAAELEPFVQARCMEAAAELAAMLQAKLPAGRPGDGAAAAADAAEAERALLVGRLAAALAWESRFLPVLLGPPEQWRAAGAAAAGLVAGGGGGLGGRAGNAGGRAGGARALVAGSRLQVVVDQLRGIAVLAFRAWAAWAAAGLVASLRASWLTDDTLSGATLPLSWQEVVIPAAGGVGGLPAGDDLYDAPVLADMRFSLPACPSVGAQALLHGACTELRRAGDHTAPAEAIQVWEWELTGAVLQCLSQLLASGGSSGAGNPASVSGATALLVGPAAGASGLLRGSGPLQLSERGVLQMLFDLRLLRDIMAGGRALVTVPAAPQAGQAVGAGVSVDLPDGAAALGIMTERRKAGNLLEQQLQDRLDPIDWATYEHHLWANVKHHYQRCLVLYGALTQLQRVHTQQDAPSAASRPGASTASINPLSVLPVAQRFQYLPIAMPSTVGSAGAGAGVGGLAGTRAGLGAGGLLGSKGRLSTAALGKLAMAANNSSSDLAGAYSFADLGIAVSARAAAGGLAAGGAPSSTSLASAAASSTAAALGASASHALGLALGQARLVGTAGGAFGSLGTLLGDKAAEVTAMAQQRFDLGNLGDFSLGSAFGSATSGLGSATTGLLSSLAKGVGGAGGTGSSAASAASVAAAQAAAAKKAYS